MHKSIDSFLNNTVDTIQQNTVVKIIDFVCGQALKSRLLELGVIQGHTVLLEKNDGHGPVILKVKGVSIALGRGIAKKIIVERIDKPI